MTVIPVDESSTEGDYEDHGSVPADLLELHEVLEWEAAARD